jgi:hypothetical protein
MSTKIEVGPSEMTESRPEQMYKIAWTCQIMRKFSKSKVMSKELKRQLKHILTDQGEGNLNYNNANFYT